MDAIRHSFLLAQAEAGKRLDGESDILSLTPLGRSPAERYVLRLRTRTLATGRETPRECEMSAVVGVWFPEDYLYRATTAQVLTWLDPDDIFHPNVRSPFLCLGALRPGTSLVELCFRIHAIVSYQNFGLTSPLNDAAASWARRNLHRFPTDPRPLKRKTTSFRTEVFDQGGAP